MVKIPCVHIAGLTSKFIHFERKFRDGSIFSRRKSNNKLVGSTSKICRFHQLMIIAKIMLFKFDICGLGQRSFIETKSKFRKHIYC